ncbi:MAG: PQQ-binding-like beta-propeller repeat protein [Proteobacteria bacterium]|nr:PQQ-binding-like beta-propeller repeat protein [Pseudomonadota bacterium]MBU4296931.1 PQQ-binding-like beta-propeller repeat protein [Pseudomonadota bacterium]MCG2746093.1 PQQ-binding-like beta-propeller repeat protein [Desulfobulbaceae bacterium]
MWAFNTGGDVFSSPTIGTDGTIYVQSVAGKLYAINPEGTPKWSIITGYESASCPTAAVEPQQRR